MIALLTTYLVLAYVLIPGVLFRTWAGFFVKLRLFQLSKTQEATLGCLVAFLPLLLANWAVWKCPFAQHHPFPYSYGSLDDYKRDYRLGFGLVVAEDPAKLLDPEREPKTVYQQAISAIWRRQLRFLSWYYGFSVIEAIAFGFLANQYGNWWGRTRVYDWVARKILLPHISEWQLLLTTFVFPKKQNREVQADILCDGILYRGSVGDYFLDTAGCLSGLLLKNAERFRRKDYETACAQANAALVNHEEFWRQIPGSNFYIPADKISNLNVRFSQPDQDIEAFLKQVLSEMDVPSGTTVTYEDQTPLPPKAADESTGRARDPDPIDPAQSHHQA